MATKYDRVNPWEEKMKRLYNCNRMINEDQKYLNYSFERYKLRSFHITSLVGGTMFIFGNIPIVKAATPAKYWSSLLIYAFTMYKWLTHKNN